VCDKLYFGFNIFLLYLSWSRLKFITHYLVFGVFGFVKNVWIHYKFGAPYHTFCMVACSIWKFIHLHLLLSSVICVLFIEGKSSLNGLHD
jgi:hypothetical protein